MSKLEGVAVAVVAGVIVYAFARSVAKGATSSSSSNAGIDPLTGGVPLPTPETYGPPKPIGADADSFMN